MSGVKGKSGPKGNKNAEIHGFYSAALLPGEGERFEEAKALSIDHEIALIRTRVHRAVMWEASGKELPEGTQYQVDRALARLRDFMLCKSIMQRNDRESGALDEDDGWMARFSATGAHRATFKGNGKSNGRSKGNGQS